MQYNNQAYLSLVWKDPKERKQYIIGRLCYGVSHTLFANAGCPCISCECPEGKMSCGRGYEKKQHIEDLKRQAE